LAENYSPIKYRFRWAQLQLEYLLDQELFNPRDLEQRLDKLESGRGKPVLDDAYDQLYRRKTGEDTGEITYVGQDLQRILKWVLASAVAPRMGLIVDALRHANDPKNFGQSAKHIDREYISRAASNFLMVENEQDGTLGFAHLSVKEYLLGARAAEYSDLESNLTIAVSCLVYVDSLSHSYQNILPSFDSAVMDFPEYALRYWSVHSARLGESGRRRAEVNNLLADLLRIDPVGRGLITLMKCWSAWLENSFYDRNIDDSIAAPPSPFFLACVWGFPEIVNIAVKQKPETVHAQAQNGRSGLHLAAYNGHAQIARRLLEAGASVNAVDRLNQTPLFLAADQGQVSTIQVLLTSKNIDVNARNRSGQTPLFLAASCGHVQAVQALLQHEGADINLDQQDLRGWTALTRATYFGHIDVVSEIIASGRKIDWDVRTDKQSALHWAFTRGQTGIACMLIQQTSIDVNMRDPEDWPPLARAARDNDCNIIRVLLSSRDELDVNAERNGRTALLYAWYREHLDAVRILLNDSRVNVNAKPQNGSPILNSALENDVLDIARLILETRPDIDINLRDSADETPLHKALGGGHSEMARMILNFEGVDINALNPNNESALSLAMAYDPDTAKLILQTRKDVDLNNEFVLGFAEDEDENSSDVDSSHTVGGFRIIHMAAMDGHSEIVKILLRDFRDRLQVDAQNERGETALHLAAKWGKTEILEMLLEDGGVRVDIFNDDGLDALHLAAGNGHLSATRALLQHGADIHAGLSNENGVTALHCAIKNGHTQVAELLQDWVGSSM
jgi:ankyrin repeat protein